MKKWLLAALTALVMAACLSPVAARAALIAGDGYAFDDASGKLTVTTNNGTANWKSDAFFGAADIKTLAVESGVTMILNQTFNGCANLQAVTLPDGLQEIGNYAFNGCTNLQAVTLPDSLNTIRYNAFSGCASLQAIVLPNSVSRFEYEAFNGCTNLASVVLPNSLSRIPRDAFENCTALAAVSIPSSVTVIDNDAFRGCEKLASVTIQDNANPLSIQFFAFQGCKNLTALVLPDREISIMNNAFKDCTSLATVSFGNKLKRLDFDAFNGCVALERVTIPGSVGAIGHGVFNGCTGLKSVTVSSGTTAIQNGVFNGCTSLVDVSLPDGLLTIGSDAFNGCTSLTDISIPNSVTRIAHSAFIGCTSLQAVTLPDSLTEIQQNAFTNCTSLARVTSSRTAAPALGSLPVFGGTTPATATLYIPFGATGYDRPGWPGAKKTCVTLSGTVTNNGRPVAGATVTLNGFSATTDAAGNYSFAIAAPINEGYTVTAVKNGYSGSAAGWAGTTAVAGVNIAILPVISAQPQSQSVARGQTAVFSVAVTGDGITYQWYVHRNDGGGWQKISGATGAQYTVEDADASLDGFRYYCHIEDAYENKLDSAVAALHVTKAPEPPKTGDSAAPWLWTALALISGAGVVLTVVKTRRRAG